jgi:ornithine cyclodeaminase
MLAEVSTGYPLLLAEMTMLTALRTAATSALERVAQKWVPVFRERAREIKHVEPSAIRLNRRRLCQSARTMALIGNGPWAEFHALAMHAVCGIETVRLYDVDSRAAEKARRNLHGMKLALIDCLSTEATVEGADIITTSTADKRSADHLDGC